jgi:O-antigen ligase
MGQGRCPGGREKGRRAVTERSSKAALLAVAALGLPVVVYLAYSRPGYFASSTYLKSVALLEVLLAAVYLYRRFFFPVVLIAFLFAGVNLPLGAGWIMARWFVLGVGALFGSLIMLIDRRLRFGLFHVVASFAVLAALVSAAVSRYPGFALMKALSLLLLFMYAGSGARLAVAGRETRFFEGLLTGCEVFVGAMAILYLLGIEAMGNPNSLGAVMGVVAAPILLWGTLLDERSIVLRRRQILCAVAMYLTFHSLARAGLAAAFVSCGLLCLALRRYKMLGQGIVIIVVLVTSSAILDPEAFSTRVSRLTEAVVYKGKDPALGLLESRQTPWQGAVETIRKHFWFGSGFGTTDTGQDASAFLNQYGGYATYETVTRENGSSYLTIATWVGMLGIVPFVFLLCLLFWNVVRVVLWMFNTGNPSHPAVPLAMVMVAGLVHAAFEDWLFAVGYYLCVFFWSLAFVLVDVAPHSSPFRFSFRLRSQPVARVWDGVTPGP